MYVVYILNITASNSIGDIPLTSIYMVKHPIFPLQFVSDSMKQSTTQIPILFLPLLRKRGDGLVLPLMLGIFSPSETLWMIPIALYITLPYVLPLYCKKRTFVSNSLKGMMTLETSSTYLGYRVR